MLFVKRKKCNVSYVPGSTRTCLCLTIHAIRAHYFTDCTYLMTCDPQPFHSCQEKCVARWTQIHGKQDNKFSGAGRRLKLIA